MKLHMLREHYQSNDNKNWTPKKTFSSEDEVKEELGFEPGECNIYKCGVCDLFHVSLGTRKYQLQ